MQQLNLPPFEYKIKHDADKTYIFDIFRKKYIVLTPEEWVRQHVAHLLLAQGYPASLIKLESGTSYNNLAKRTDIQVFDRDGNLFMLVECKAPHIKIDEKVSSQAALYGKTLRPRHIFLSNGMVHYIFACDYATGKLSPINELPELT